MDLSKVLGDVYEDAQPAPDRPSAGQVPEWSDDARLDEAFANWTPGPPAGAPAAEYEAMAGMTSAPSANAALDDDLASALSAALIGPESDDERLRPAVTAEPAPRTVELTAVIAPVEDEATAEEPAVAAAWRRSDDDVLPGRSAGRPPKAAKPAKELRGRHMRRAR